MTDLHILLVDDHDFTRSMEKRVLVDLGVARITEARDGNEALECARAARPDIVISDLNMPGMDGMTFISHLAQERLADSVIIASGLAPGVLKAVEAMAVASGVRVLGAIEKPLRKDALASMLYLHEHPAGGEGGGVPAIDAAAVERAVELGQFKTWFSPVLDVQSMRVVAADVVARWESPEHGIKVGDEELEFLLELPAAPAVMRSLIQSSLAAGGLWRQMGWSGMLTLPSGLATVRDSALWDWLPQTVRKNGANGTVALGIDAAIFARDPARGAFGVARAMMDKYFVNVRLRLPADLDGLKMLAACNVVTCPVEWVEGEPAAMRRVRDFAARFGADVGVSGVDSAAQLARLAGAGIRLAQGYAIGRPASAAETYDSHLAHR